MRGTKQALAGPVFICVFTRFFTGGHRPKQQIKQQSRAEQNLLIFKRNSNSDEVSLSTCDKATIAVLNCTILIETRITKKKPKKNHTKKPPNMWKFLIIPRNLITSIRKDGKFCLCVCSLNHCAMSTFNPSLSLQQEHIKER